MTVLLVVLILILVALVLWDPPHMFPFSIGTRLALRSYRRRMQAMSDEELRKTYWTTNAHPQVDMLFAAEFHRRGLRIPTTATETTQHWS